MSLRQPVWENLISSVTKRTDITLFNLAIVYDMKDDEDAYKDLLKSTPKGTAQSHRVVPDMARFTKLVQQIETVRADGRPGCSVKLLMAGIPDDEEVHVLLKADYDAPARTNILGSRSPKSKRSGKTKSDTTAAPVDEARITFRLGK